MSDTLSIDSIAELLEVCTNHITSVVVSNFYSTNIGGGGHFYWDATGNKGSHNGGTIIDPTHTVTPGSAGWWSSQNSTPDGVWRRIYTANYIDVAMFGIKNDGTTNVADAIYQITQSFTDDINLFFPPGEYLINANTSGTPSTTTITANITVVMGGNATFKVESSYTLNIAGTITSVGTYPFAKGASLGTISLNTGNNRSSFASAIDVDARTYSELTAGNGADGPNPTDNGVMFSTLNTAGERKVFAAIMGEAKTKTDGTEQGRLNFLTNDGDFSQPVGTVDHNGAWIFGPGMPPFSAEIAGIMSFGPGTALLGERLSVVDPDYEDCRALAIRNLKSTPTTGFRVGHGLVMRNANGEECTVGLLRARYSDTTAGSHHSYMYVSTFVAGVETDGPYFYNKQLYDNGRFIGPDKDTLYTGEISDVKSLSGSGSTDLVEVELDDNYGACIIEMNVTGRGTSGKQFALCYKRHVSINNGSSADIRTIGTDHIFASIGASSLSFSYTSGNKFKVTFTDDTTAQTKYISFNARVMGGCGDNGTSDGITSIKKI